MRLCAKVETGFGGKGANQAVAAAKVCHTSTPHLLTLSCSGLLVCLALGCLRVHECAPPPPTTTTPAAATDLLHPVPQLGGSVGMVTKVGADSFGRETIANYLKHGISDVSVLTTPDASTGMAMICVGE